MRKRGWETFSLADSLTRCSLTLRSIDVWLWSDQILRGSRFNQESCGADAKKANTQRSKRTRKFFECRAFYHTALVFDLFSLSKANRKLDWAFAYIHVHIFRREQLVHQTCRHVCSFSPPLKAWLQLERETVNWVKRRIHWRHTGNFSCSDFTSAISLSQKRVVSYGLCRPCKRQSSPDKERPLMTARTTKESLSKNKAH